MKFDTPAGTNPIDQGKIVGKPVDRIDGPLKTTGMAPYAYEHHDLPGKAAYGHVVGAGIAKGTIRSIDLSAARNAPGVLGIVTAQNAGKLQKGKLNTAKLLGGPEIQHYHQAIAVVVAETFEQARAAGQLIKVDYGRHVGEYDLARARPKAEVTKEGGAPNSTVGDFAGAFTAAPVQLDAEYTTPDHSHAMMEPHASIAMWEGDKLNVWTSNQMINWGAGDLARTLGLPPENVRLMSPYIGGLRRQAVPACRCGACCTGRAPGEAAGEGDAAAAVDCQQHHPSPGDRATHPHRRTARREDHCHRA